MDPFDEPNDPAQKTYIDESDNVRKLFFFAKLGQTDQSIVYSALDQDVNPNRKVAIKITKNTGGISGAMFDNACAALSSCDSKYVVKFYGKIFSNDRMFVGMVMEYMESDLYKFIENPQNILNEIQLRQIMGQILCGLKYIHSIGILHPDLHPSNILITMDPHGYPHVRLTGFSYAAKLPPQGLIQRQFGNPIFWSPEIILNQPFSFSANIWSAGLVMYYIIKRLIPFDPSRTDLMFTQILNFNQMSLEGIGLSQLQKSLILGMMRREPSERFTVNDCLNHEWLAGFLTKENSNSPLLMNTLYVVLDGCEYDQDICQS
ncbi:kinase domain protein [Histomonas meleagridis]|uniref:kinase domain protein n=1 Tax=Histomonas meleagridis TaxID=135588 RepID=UPI0035597F38|nr:kinase domain protein [Histomonas meleagridis]KAH0804875.1 kinase domain protein [Histomonas meleagridis]